MLRVRVIPTLLIKERDLVKSLNFQNYIYVGDPINTIKIFNEKNCDEIFIYDISEDRSKPIDFEYLKIIACESRMPVGYGGRVNSIEDIERILSIGIEKISLNSILFSNEKLLIDASKKFGKQSIVATIDIKKINTNYFIHTKNGKEKINIDLNKYLKFLQEYVGELIIQELVWILGGQSKVLKRRSTNGNLLGMRESFYTQKYLLIKLLISIIIPSFMTLR